MPITWRNIDLGSNGAANSLLVNAGEQITSGLNRLTNLAEEARATNVQNYETVAKNNTVDALDKLNSVRTSADLATAANGGALDTAVLDSKFGKQYNKGAVSDAVTNKLSTLLATEKATATAAKLEAERLQDRELSLRRAADNETRLKQAHAWTTQDHNLKMATMQREQQYSAAASEIIRNSPSQDVAKSRLSKLSMDLNKDGLLPADRVFSLEKSYVDQINGTGLNEAQRAQVQFEQGQAGKLADTINTGVDKLLTEYRKASGFDSDYEDLANDRMTVGDAVIELEKQIKDKGVTNTVPIAARVDEINNAFAANGLPAPNGRVVKEILTQGGHDDKFLGFDAAFELNRDFLNSMIGKASKNLKYKEISSEAELKFLNMKTQATNDLTTALTANAAERAQEAYARKYSNQYKEAQVTDIGALQTMFDQRMKELRKEIQNAKKVNDPNIVETPISGSSTKQRVLDGASALAFPLAPGLAVSRLTQ